MNKWVKILLVAIAIFIVGYLLTICLTERKSSRVLLDIVEEQNQYIQRIDSTNASLLTAVNTLRTGIDSFGINVNQVLTDIHKIDSLHNVKIRMQRSYTSQYRQRINEVSTQRRKLFEEANKFEQ